MNEHQLPANYRISVKALIRNAEGKMLLVKVRKREWGVPGGGLEHGESVEAGLRRELHEELGVDVESISNNPILAAPYYYEPRNRWKFRLLYEVALAGEPKVGHDSVAIGWFSKDEILTLKLSDREPQAIYDMLELL
jgi:8-oxo-dGTP diphosphatase